MGVRFMARGKSWKQVADDQYKSLPDDIKDAWADLRHDVMDH